MKRLRAQPLAVIVLCLLGGLATPFLVVGLVSAPAIADDPAPTASSSTGSSLTDTTSNGETASTTTATTTRAVPPAPKRRPKPPAVFTFAGGGDVSLAGNPDPSALAAIRPYLRRSDLAVANLEGTLGTSGSPRCLVSSSATNACFTFRASTGWAATLKRAGFTDLNVANNHALDFGPDGQRTTLAALRDAGLSYDGLPGQITYLRAKGISVAVIGCAPYNWAQSLLDVRGTQTLVRKASRRAQVVIVYMHAGAEGADADQVADREESYLGEDRGNPVAFAHAMVNAGADLVFASGPHVLRGMEWYRGRLIAYSLGNLASTHTLSTSGTLAESALLRVTLDTRGRFVRGSIVSFRLDAWGTPSVDPTRASLRLVRSLSREDFPRSFVSTSSKGTIVRRANRRVFSSGRGALSRVQTKGARRSVPRAARRS